MVFIIMAYLRSVQIVFNDSSLILLIYYWNIICDRVLNKEKVKGLEMNVKEKASCDNILYLLINKCPQQQYNMRIALSLLVSNPLL